MVGAGRAIWDVAARHAIEPWRAWARRTGDYDDLYQEARFTAWQTWKERPRASDPVAYLITAARRALIPRVTSIRAYAARRDDLDQSGWNPTYTACESMGTLNTEDRTLLTLRFAGANWTECGKAIGVSRQNASERASRLYASLLGD